MSFSSGILPATRRLLFAVTLVLSAVVISAPAMAQDSSEQFTIEQYLRQQNQTGLRRALS